jgi:hypothetical protein
MADGVRYIVQIKVEGKDWADYGKTHARKGRYTLTSGEAFAYMATLPATARVWKTENYDNGSAKRVRVEVAAEYRVISSVKTYGLISQKILSF